MENATRIHFSLMGSAQKKRESYGPVLLGGEGIKVWKKAFTTAFELARNGSQSEVFEWEIEGELQYHSRVYIIASTA